MNEASVYRRVLRRERFRSRSLAVSVTLLLLAVAAAYFATEWVLAGLGFDAILLSPQRVIDAINAPSALVVAGAGAAVVAGLVVIAIALSPGRRARRTLSHDRLAIVIDDVALAGAFGRAVRSAASVSAERVRTTISARKAVMSVTRSSGIPIDQAQVDAAARELATDLSVTPRIAVSVAVASTGVVGS